MLTIQFSQICSIFLSAEIKLSVKVIKGKTLLPIGVRVLNVVVLTRLMLKDQKEINVLLNQFKGFLEKKVFLPLKQT